jgi:hypothetical protein
VKRLVPVTTALLLSSCAAPPQGTGVLLGGDASASLEENVNLLGDVITRYDPAIQRFASLAAQSNVEELMKLFLPALKASMGEEAIRKKLELEVIPFFADYEKVVDGSIHPATFPDGRRGAPIYTYMMTKAGVRKPFTIWLLVEGDQALVGLIEVGRCVHGRHPSCGGA